MNIEQLNEKAWNYIEFVLNYGSLSNIDKVYYLYFLQNLINKFLDEINIELEGQ